MTNRRGDALPQRKRTRLDGDRYADTGEICSVTIAVRDRQPIFSDRELADGTVNVLKQLAASTGVCIYGYCVMPDHTHLILSASSRCDVITFIGRFKNLAQRTAWERGVAGRIWQRGFWDHFLRLDEDVERAVAYVLNNPVRAHLATQWHEYPFAGSLEWDI